MPTDLVAAQAQWHDWVVAACAAVDVDPALVDVTTIHDLTRDIAHDVARPMAPVGAFILGMAVARQGADRAAALGAALRGSTVPDGRMTP